MNYVLGERAAIRLRELLSSHAGAGDAHAGDLGQRPTVFVRVTGPAVDGWHPCIPTEYDAEAEEWDDGDGDEAGSVLCPDATLVTGETYEAVPSDDDEDGSPRWVTGGRAASWGYATQTDAGVVSLADQVLGAGIKKFSASTEHLNPSNNAYYSQDIVGLTGGTQLWHELRMLGVGGFQGHLRVDQEGSITRLFLGNGAYPGNTDILSVLLDYAGDGSIVNLFSSGAGSSSIGFTAVPDGTSHFFIIIGATTYPGVTGTSYAGDTVKGGIITTIGSGPPAPPPVTPGQFLFGGM